MSELRLDRGRRLVVCDVCLTYAADDDPVTATWHRETPCGPGTPAWCPDCIIPPRFVAVAAPFTPT